MDPNQFRGAIGQFTSGVTVITCQGADDQPHGVTCTAVTSISLDPRLCLLSINRKSAACGKLGSNGPFAVNILASDQADTAMSFAGRPERTEPRWIDGTGAPLLEGAAATISCVTIWREYDGGDHSIFLGEVVEAQSSGGDPLLFYRRSFDLGATLSTTVWGLQDEPHDGWFDATTYITPIDLIPGPQTI
nr:reductase [Rhodococcus sp. (in: high G+C Gram-positive bacteria)]